MVYETASRDEERLFIEAIKEVIEKVREPEPKKRDPTKHAGGRPVSYPFRPMLLVLHLMAYHRKEYREMEAHLKANPQLLKEIGLGKAPGKSTIHRALSRVSMETLLEVNDAITARFKKREGRRRRSTLP